MPCTASCPIKHPGLAWKWCDDCQRDFERYLDEQGQFAAAALVARESAAVTPSSDAEWTRRFDELAPIVPHDKETTR